MNISPEQTAALTEKLAADSGIRTIGYAAASQELLVERTGDRRVFHVYAPVSADEFDRLTKAPSLRHALGDVSRDKSETHFAGATATDFAPAGGATMDMVTTPDPVVIDGAKGDQEA